MDTGVALEAAESVRDHHDYAKRHRDDATGECTSPPPPVKKGRLLRDPEGGTYISARSRARKEPLPMKLRALPASFWEQPNHNKGPSPGTIFSALPPLCKEEAVVSPSASTFSPRTRDADTDCTDGAGEGGEGGEGHAEGAGPGALVSHSAADTDLLFSLFRSVEAKEAKGTERPGRTRTRGRWSLKLSLCY
ncbi:uncharacterized protein LOC117646002 [Thrips palmi]|uniref:Uncharacterized protein LOC117646002 n=1 Tax=Thrips palmi TaxID=161013 RepID=A0A6P8YYY6_THRPL|nr:uncharacterized protein LOC117646002 [Thrips palmi]